MPPPVFTCITFPWPGLLFCLLCVVVFCLLVKAVACDVGWGVGLARMQVFRTLHTFNYLEVVVVVSTGLGSLYTYVRAMLILPILCTLCRAKEAI